LPAILALHDTDAVPDPMTLVGVIAPHVSPAGTVSARLTLPLKRFNEVMVIVEVADCVESTGPEVVTDVVKSRNWKRAVAEWTREPLVPITVRV